MSDLPPGWTHVRLADVARTQLGRMLSSHRETGAYAKPYLRNRDVQWGEINVADLPTMDFGPKDAERFRLAEGDVLVCEGGEVGRAAVWKGQLEECYFQKALHRVRASSALSPTYLRHLLEYYAKTREFEKFTSGSTIAHLPQEDLRSLPITLPPIKEQESIVAAIEEQFSRVDVGVTALKRVRISLERLREAALEDAMSHVRELGAVETHLQDVMSEGRKIAYGVLVPGDDVPDGIPLIRIGDLKDRRVDRTSLKRISPAVAAKFPRTTLRGGEVLLSVVGTIGRTAVVPVELAGANTARAVAVIPVCSDVDPRYLSMALDRKRVSIGLTELAHEVARKTLNLEDVRRYAVLVPSYNVQLAIVDRIESLESALAAVEHMVSSAERRADHLRIAVLSSAFSGTLVGEHSADDAAPLMRGEFAGTSSVTAVSDTHGSRITA